MKHLLLFILFFWFLSSRAQQYTLYTYYATCNESQGEFDVVGGPIDSVVWSNGARGTHLTNVDPGRLDAYIYYQGIAVDTLGGNMFHDTWRISLFPCSNFLCINIYLPNYQNSLYIHPDCAPVGSYKVIVWEDSIPKDTLIFTNFTSLSYVYTNVISGHRYDVSIYDPGCGCYEGTWSNSAYAGMVVLNLKAYIQGLYNSGELTPALFNIAGNPNPDASDSVFIELHQVNNPNSVVATSSAIINKDGHAQVFFPNSILFQNLFVAVKHRNSVETWSKNPVNIGSGNITYDFSTAASQAYDDNQVALAVGHYAIYSGDVNQDGGVDALDMTLVENDSNAGTFGYIATDLNGDGSGDALDMTIIETNGNLGVFEAHP